MYNSIILAEVSKYIVAAVAFAPAFIYTIYKYSDVFLVSYPDSLISIYSRRSIIYIMRYAYVSRFKIWN